MREMREVGEERGREGRESPNPQIQSWQAYLTLVVSQHYSQTH